jgi:hypothetical protein
VHAQGAVVGPVNGHLSVAGVLAVDQDPKLSGFNVGGACAARAQRQGYQ